jgi:hypothetical protein
MKLCGCTNLNGSEHIIVGYIQNYLYLRKVTSDTVHVHWISYPELQTVAIRMSSGFHSSVEKIFIHLGYAAASLGNLFLNSSWKF